MSSSVWYVARSAGIVAYLVLSSSVVLGVLISARLPLTWPRFAVRLRGPAAARLRTAQPRA